MMRLHRLAAMILALGLGAGALEGQASLVAKCDLEAVQTIPGARNACLAAVQGVVSAQPALGLTVAGGNPTIGSAGTAGLRVGLLPRLSAGVRANVVGVKIPDLLADQLGDDLSEIAKDYGLPAPAVTGDVAVGVFGGFPIAPGVGEVGGISLLASASYLPLSLFDDAFDNTDFAWGIGARLHVLNESFLTPGVSVSLMRRELPEVELGDVCPGGIEPPGDGPEIDDVEFGGCAGPGDIGQFSFDLTNWSTRILVGKHFVGLGALLGLGFDRYTSDLGFGFRGEAPVGELAPAFRVNDQRLESSQWSFFGNLSYSFLAVTLALEGGWQQGAGPVSGFQNAGGDFDPDEGIWFAGLGLRVGL